VTKQGGINHRAVVDPFAGGGDPLAGRKSCGVANSHDVPMPAHLGAQNAKRKPAIVTIELPYFPTNGRRGQPVVVVA
jgi:hypothetical protein